MSKSRLAGKADFGRKSVQDGEGDSTVRDEKEEVPFLSEKLVFCLGTLPRLNYNYKNIN